MKNIVILILVLFIVCSCRHTKQDNDIMVRLEGIKQEYFTPVQWENMIPVDDGFLTLEAWVNINALIENKNYYVNIIKFEENFIRKVVDYSLYLNKMSALLLGEGYETREIYDPWDFANDYPEGLVSNYRRKYNTNNIFLFESNVLLMFADYDIGPFSKYMVGVWSTQNK